MMTLGEQLFVLRMATAMSASIRHGVLHISIGPPEVRDNPARSTP